MALKDQIVHVAGRNVGDVMVYALSTCQWCNKTKELLNSLHLEYRYVDVNLLDKEDEEEVDRIFEKLRIDMIFPVIVVNGEDLIIGYQEAMIRGLVK